ncbi:hypothetical protein KA977_15195 [Candidatus Dependentiae bacterium]|nr:hypothetical protein [Candidatus Dependentiae bacterium]
MVIFLNAGILLFLSLICFKLFGWAGLILSLIIFGVIYSVIQLFTTIIDKNEFNKIDLSYINLFDILLYKILGPIFLKFRKQHEISIENFYHNIEHFFTVKFKMYASIIFFIAAITFSFFFVEFEKSKKKIQDNSIFKNYTATSNHIKLPAENFRGPSQNSNGMISHTDSQSSEDVNTSEDIYFYKLHIIQEFKKKYGDDWENAIIRAVDYYKKKNINNSFMKAFADKTESVNSDITSETK